MVLVLVNFCPIRNRAALCIMDETLDVQLPPWFAISNSTLKSNSLKKKINSKWMWSCVCPICNATACKLMEENGQDDCQYQDVTITFHNNNNNLRNFFYSNLHHTLS